MKGKLGKSGRLNKASAEEDIQRLFHQKQRERDIVLPLTTPVRDRMAVLFSSLFSGGPH